MQSTEWADPVNLLVLHASENECEISAESRWYRPSTERVQLLIERRLLKVCPLIRARGPSQWTSCVRSPSSGRERRYVL